MIMSQRTDRKDRTDRTNGMEWNGIGTEQIQVQTVRTLVYLPSQQQAPSIYPSLIHTHSSTFNINIAYMIQSFVPY